MQEHLRTILGLARAGLDPPANPAANAECLGLVKRHLLPSKIKAPVQLRAVAKW